MQHWGAPTRLVDWSYSFYVAAFFALADVKPGQRCTIWALDYHWCRKRLRELTGGGNSKDVPRSMEKLLLAKRPPPGLYPVNPFLLHERLGVQQGVFVASGDVRRSFLANYEAMRPATRRAPLRRLDVICSRKLLTDAYRDLRRMNVTYASLFPGLDGFGKHIGNMIPVLHTIPDDDTELE
jgi:hypothetical protein